MERYDLNAVPNASSEAAGVLRIANEVDEKNCGCKDAAITPSNLYNLLDFRKANTAYTGNEIVACPYHTEFLLKCVQAGITSATLLDTTSITTGQVLEDGGVKWTVIAKAIIDASISGKVITLTFADETTKTLTTQDTNTNTALRPNWSGEVSISNTTGGFAYTTPSNGYLAIRKSIDGDSSHIKCYLYYGNSTSGRAIAGLDGNLSANYKYPQTGFGIMLIPVAKGETYYFVTPNTTYWTMNFIPAKAVTI